MEKPFNIIITNVSLVSLNHSDFSIRERTYKDSNGNIINGQTTNEAPIKSICKRLSQKGEKLDAIVYIESTGVCKPIKDGLFDNQTHIEFLKSKVNSYIRENMGGTDFEDIIEKEVSIEDEPSANDVCKTVFDVNNIMVDFANRTDRDIHVYIESNGGVRYVLTMLLSVMNTLTTNYKNIKIVEITSMVFSESSAENKEKHTLIKNSKDVYDTTNVTAIVDEFFSYGRIHNLKRYADSLKWNLTEENIIDMNTVISKLEEASDNIQLCRTSMMLENFYGPENIGIVIENYLDRYKDKTESGQSIFCFLLRCICIELKKWIYPEYKNSVSDISFNLPGMIRWCLEKNFIQQALTLCAERIPAYLFATGKFVPHTEVMTILNQVDTKDYDPWYFYIANFEKCFMAEIRKLKYREICSLLREYDINGILDLNVDTVEIRHESNIDISKRVWQLFQDYMKMSSSNRDKRQKIKALFERHGFSAELLDFKVEVSTTNKTKRTPVFDVLNGRSINGNNELVWNNNLKNPEIRFKKAIKAFSENCIQEDNTMMFNQIVDEVFTDDPVFANTVKDRYCIVQGKKYNLSFVLRENYISSNISDYDIQKILYLFAICKEQRNLANHAKVSDENLPVAMNSTRLNKVISELLRMC